MAALAGGSTDDGVIDLSAVPSPRTSDHAGAAFDRGCQGAASTRLLWGELEAEGPPRWRQSRRRSQLGRAAGSPLPPPLLPPAAVASPARSRARPATTAAGHAALRRALAQATAAAAVATEGAHESGGARLVRRMQARELAESEEGTVLRRMQEREDAMAVASELLREEEDNELARRMEELEALERASGWDAAPGPWGPHGPWGPPPSSAWRDGPRRGEPGGAGSRPRFPQRRRAWAPGALAEATMGMLSEDALFAGMRFMPARAAPGMAGDHLAAVHEAFARMSAQRLPPQLLFSDRDFTEADYEMLLALDEGVENRRGATADAIDNIPTTVVGAAGPAQEEGKDTRCPICLEELVAGAVLRRLACGHTSFHRACIDRWLAQKACCPICQRPPV
ncbi:hypothetical protein WJX81_005373 [Elliptochloris bilobata]|uniref:RING-type domain-containing protein n=1 Tax=Elliptochloris bilobata TaxID=381761 RepID=A0AAW1SCG3_9CHLO